MLIWWQIRHSRLREPPCSDDARTYMVNLYLFTSWGKWFVNKTNTAIHSRSSNVHLVFYLCLEFISFIRSVSKHNNLIRCLIDMLTFGQHRYIRLEWQLSSLTEQSSKQDHFKVSLYHSSPRDQQYDKRRTYNWTTMAVVRKEMFRKLYLPAKFRKKYRNALNRKVGVINPLHMTPKLYQHFQFEQYIKLRSIEIFIGITFPKRVAVLVTFEFDYCLFDLVQFFRTLKWQRLTFTNVVTIKRMPPIFNVIKRRHSF